jgi:ribosomal protein S18
MNKNIFLNNNDKNAIESILKKKQITGNKDIDFLKKFTSSEGKILPSRRNGLSAKNQRKISKAIKKARCIGLLPFRNQES